MSNVRTAPVSTSSSSSSSTSTPPFTERDATHFNATYRDLVRTVVDAEKRADYNEAVKLNFEMARLIQSVLTRLARDNTTTLISRDTALSLERESMGRVLRAYTLASLQNVNFGDLAISTANEKRIFP